MKLTSIRGVSTYVTTPIFYVNGPPHLGHLYSCVLADAHHRWNILKDPEGKHIFSTGTDEHGSKIAKAARESNVEVKLFCDNMSSSFFKLCNDFGIRNSAFVRTTEERHRRCVEEMWNRLDKSNSIVKGQYSGWYSTTDECFYQDADVEDLPDGSAKVSRETRSRVEWHEEENYMFTLDRYQEDVRKWLNTEDVIRPTHYRSIAARYVNAESRLSISRDRTRLQWGIPVPGDPSQTVYVWLDALCSYLTATGFPSSSPILPTTQVIGKDILKFHAVYWPAFLMAAGLPLPKSLLIHAHWLVEGMKMSKSVGNVVDPFVMSEKISREGLRYFLLKQGVPHEDSSFGVLKAINVINADLVNNLANLVTRACASKINARQVYPHIDTWEWYDSIASSARPLINEMNELREKVEYKYERLLFYKAIEDIMDFSRHTNAFFQVHAPWKMPQGPRLNTVLHVTYEAIRVISILMQPLTPQLAAYSLDRLGISDRSLSTATFGGAAKADQSGHTLGENNGMYMNRLETDEGNGDNEKRSSRRTRRSS